MPLPDEPVPGDWEPDTVGDTAAGWRLAAADWLADGVPEPPATGDVTLPHPAATTEMKATVRNRARMT